MGTVINGDAAHRTALITGLVGVLLQIRRRNGDQFCDHPGDQWTSVAFTSAAIA